MIRYRLHQLYHALWPKVSPAEYRWVKAVLSPSATNLFLKQSLPEQRHALDVARDIKGQRTVLEETFGKETTSYLIQAALLHDCGKCLYPLQLWQRIFVVGVSHLPPRWQQSFQRQKGRVGETMKLYTQHAIWGTQLSAEAGLNLTIQNLIANHHSPTSQLERILYEADCKH